MLGIIKNLLLKLIDDIDAGNSNLNEEETMKIVSILKEVTCKDNPLSKYMACQYLNVSRATFDNLVRKGVISRGKKIPGFKELMWTKKDFRQCYTKVC